MASEQIEITANEQTIVDVLLYEEALPTVEELISRSGLSKSVARRSILSLCGKDVISIDLIEHIDYCSLSNTGLTHYGLHTY